MEENKLLEVKDLKISFFTPAGEVKAVGGISYDLNYGEVMGIVGESGSGKSQEAYSIIGLLQSPGKVVGGSITFEGKDVLAMTKDEMTSFRGKDVAMMFRAIIEDRPKPKIEKMVGGYSGFLYLDKNDLPEVALHWEHRFRHMATIGEESHGEESDYYCRNHPKREVEQSQIVGFVLSYNKHHGYSH